MWAPGEVLAIDWGSAGALHVFCAVLAWSRVRFVRFAGNERADTTLSLLAECFEELGGVPKVVLADRMGCLKGGVVANKVVPTADYVRFATHYSFRPDWCEAADPESKGIVENLVGYAKRDLVVPQAPFTDLARQRRGPPMVRGGEQRAALGDLRDPRRAAGHRAGAADRPAVAAAGHRQVRRDPQGGPAVVRAVRVGPLLGPVRLIGHTVDVIASGGRVKVTGHATDEVVADHALVAPGEASIDDAHYGGPGPTPRRAARPRRGEGVLRPRPGPRSVPHGRGRRR